MDKDTSRKYLRINPATGTSTGRKGAARWKGLNNKHDILEITDIHCKDIEMMNTYVRKDLQNSLSTTTKRHTEVKLIKLVQNYVDECDGNFHISVDYIQNTSAAGYRSMLERRTATASAMTLFVGATAEALHPEGDHRLPPGLQQHPPGVGQVLFFMRRLWRRCRKSGPQCYTRRGPRRRNKCSPNRAADRIPLGDVRKGRQLRACALKA